MFQPSDLSIGKGQATLATSAAHARKAAESLFQSSENPSVARVNRKRPRPIRAQAQIVSIRRYVIARLLERGRMARDLEFLELPLVPGQSKAVAEPAAVLLLISGSRGRTLYLSLEVLDAPCKGLPSWWRRVGEMGHSQRRIQAVSALDAWRSTERLLRQLGFIEG